MAYSGYTIPNDDGTANGGIIARPFSQDLQIVAEAIRGNKILSGCLVSVGSTLLQYSVSSGFFVREGVMVASAGVTNNTLNAADATNPRIDLISLNDSGTVVYTAGTAASAATVVPPAIPQAAGNINNQVVAYILVPALLTTLVAGDIVDKRIIMPVGHPYILDKASTVANFSYTSSATRQIIYSKSILANLLSTGRILRLTLWGTFLNNTATKVLTWDVKFGSTTMWADPSPTAASNAQRRSWKLELILHNQNATNVQILSARIAVGNVGTTTSGTGDTATSDLAGPTVIGGTAAEDTTASKTLEIGVAWASAAANQDLNTDGAILELML